MNIIEGNFHKNHKRIAIIASRFNSFIVDNLVGGAEDALIRHGIPTESIDLYRIPGAFEFPGFLSHLLDSEKAEQYDGIICLGAVIKGETPHFDFVANEATKGIAQIAMTSSIPVMFGILTTDTLDQAVNRAGAKSGNKGYDCAVSLLEMMDLYKKVSL